MRCFMMNGFDTFDDGSQFEFTGQDGGMGYSQEDFEMTMMNYRGPKENYFFTMDYNSMLKLGFNQEELNVLQQAVDYYGVVSNQKLSTPPFLVCNQTIIARIMYAYNICMGKKNIDFDNPVSLAQHFKKLNSISGGNITFSCFYIPHRNIDRVPRVAVVAGLPRGSFYVLNSKLYDKTEATYRVDKIAQEWVTIQSERKMSVCAGDRLNSSYENRQWGIPDILKVEEVGSFAQNKPWVIKIHKKYCRLCNRFLIVATTKKMVPGVTEHHGGYVLVTAEGQIVYLYARTTDFDNYGNPKDTIPNTTKDTIVLDYGFYRMEIEQKLQSGLEAIASRWPIVFSKRLEGDTQFNEIPSYSGMEQIKGIVVDNNESLNESPYDDID